VRVYVYIGRGPAFLPFSGCHEFIPGVKQSGCDIYHSLLASAEVRNVWSYTYTPSVCPHDRNMETHTHEIYT